MGVPGVECFDWTSDAVERLKALYADGLSASHIAVELACGVSRNAVIGKVHRLGLQRRGRTNFNSTTPKPPQRPAAREEAGMVRRIAKKAVAPVEEPIVDLPPDQSPDAVAFLERKRSQCCWPLGFPAADMLVCGSRRDGEHSYCGRHHRLSVQASRPRTVELSDTERARRVLQARKNLAAHKERMANA